MECKKYNVAVLAGDGIGPEVCKAGKQVMQAAAEKDGQIAFHFTDLLSFFFRILIILHISRYLGANITNLLDLSKH